MTTGPARALLRRLGQFLDGFSACFSRQPQREAATQYLDGLFNDSERKSMQAMHGRLSDPGQYQALQHFITHSPWDAARVWAHLRTVVPVRAGILAIDDTGFPKQGTRSVGVQRQYCGALGKIGNCQVAVSSAFIADGRTWPLTSALVDLVALARSRWPIEQQYRELKDDLGLDHFEGRTYQGWAHHVVLTAVAFTFLQIERGRRAVEPRPTLPVVRGWVREIMGLLYVIHNRRLLSMLDSFRRNAPLRR